MGIRNFEGSRPLLLWLGLWSPLHHLLMVNGAPRLLTLPAGLLTTTV